MKVEIKEYKNKFGVYEHEEKDRWSLLNDFISKGEKPKPIAVFPTFRNAVIWCERRNHEIVT